MDDKRIRITLNIDEMKPVVDRLVAIYDAIQAEYASRPNTGKIIAIPFVWRQHIPSRMDSVKDRITGLGYAAWAIGEALACSGGHDLLHMVFDAFQERKGCRGASWLDHRWNGVTDGHSVWWVA